MNNNDNNRYSNAWRLFAVLVLFLFFAPIGEALDNGLGAKPAMGWNTWCVPLPCGTDVCNETEIHEMVDAMATNGMAELGYEYINLDDCWADQERNSSTGELQPVPSEFPSGMAALADYVHSRGFKLGVYTDAGYQTCRGDRPGSLFHYRLDARTFANWGVDYVKMDWCNTGILDPRLTYPFFRDALNETGRQIWFEMCEWGIDDPWKWGRPIANSWRTGEDMHDDWDDLIYTIDHNVGLSSYSAPGGWNYLDFLMTGNGGMTDLEYITQFSFWSLLASPLIVATDIRNMTDVRKAILLNAEVIAIDQLGRQGDRLVVLTNETEVWGTSLEDQTEDNLAPWCVILFNRGDNNIHQITFDFTYLGWPAGTNATVRDLWLHEDVGTWSGYYEDKVPPHAVTMVTIVPLD